MCVDLQTEQTHSEAADAREYHMVGIRRVCCAGVHNISVMQYLNRSVCVLEGPGLNKKIRKRDAQTEAEIMYCTTGLPRSTWSI